MSGEQISKNTSLENEWRDTFSDIKDKDESDSDFHDRLMEDVYGENNYPNSTLEDREKMADVAVDLANDRFWASDFAKDIDLAKHQKEREKIESYYDTMIGNARKNLSMDSDESRKRQYDEMLAELQDEKEKVLSEQENPLIEARKKFDEFEKQKAIEASRPLNDERAKNIGFMDYLEHGIALVMYSDELNGISTKDKMKKHINGGFNFASNKNFDKETSFDFIDSLNESELSRYKQQAFKNVIKRGVEKTSNGAYENVRLLIPLDHQRLDEYARECFVNVDEETKRQNKFDSLTGFVETFAHDIDENRMLNQAKWYYDTFRYDDDLDELDKIVDITDTLVKNRGDERLYQNYTKFMTTKALEHQYDDYIRGERKFETDEQFINRLNRLIEEYEELRKIREELPTTKYEDKMPLGDSGNSGKIYNRLHNIASENEKSNRLDKKIRLVNRKINFYNEIIVLPEHLAQSGISINMDNYDRAETYFAYKDSAAKASAKCYAYVFEMKNDQGEKLWGIFSEGASEGTEQGLYYGVGRSKEDVYSMFDYTKADAKTMMGIMTKNHKNPKDSFKYEFNMDSEENKKLYQKVEEYFVACMQNADSVEMIEKNK